MTRDANIDPQLLGDALVDVVDDIRRSVHGALGTRQYRVFVITRRWSGDKLGLGVPLDALFEIEPAPTVTWTSKARSGPGGREDTSDATLTDVSLRYVLSDLMADNSDGRTETVYRIDDSKGQRQDPQYFALASSPNPRRGDKSGDATDWLIRLSRVQDFSPGDSAT